MPTRSDRYRARAEECLIKAMMAHDPEVRRQFTDMAAQWHELADNADREEARSKGGG